MPATTSSRSRSARCGAPSPGAVRPAGRSVAAPAATSSGPTITATSAPERSAAFIWAFMLRWSNERSALTPALRSSSVMDSASWPPTASMTYARTRCVEAGQTPRRRRREGSARCRRRSRRHRYPRPAERLDQAVVAAASTDGVLRGVDGVGRELEQGVVVVVEPRTSRGSISKAMPSTLSPCWTRSKRACASGQKLQDLAASTIGWSSGRRESRTRSG